MKNIWIMARAAMNDDMATAMLANAIRQEASIPGHFRKDLVRSACYGQLRDSGWGYNDFVFGYKIPAFNEWFEAIVDEIWSVVFEPKVTKAA